VKSMVKKVDALEIETLRLRLTEAEEALQAISKGMIDALVVRGPTGPQISTLSGAEEPYRLVVERMHEGALTLDEDRQILYSNRHLISWAIRSGNSSASRWGASSRREKRHASQVCSMPAQNGRPAVNSNSGAGTAA
jgi:hypothetical protein